ncbi:hypothetical protein A3I34_02160 [Candidatus Jorgensenbacteria bacterium RIFCSPLOWO2_02_FULL_45_12]|uniref:Type II secretion system protein n=2 Tax=Candidatus Joergenseniibacteriota TaxID=1752739 RepID=A0A1F6BP10_9BACT|nr:MAG: hypothetical protein UX22_C0024G0003 [Candidatus Jorgensenbacteria bacterium GW2011_GWA2_45_9]OGG38660.1 MAG: hypothetical protein A3D55_00145 [Candidatus Jorgensenbacteria bacterium RIFCSPHIGHO2_02_FULL_45_20]OGG42593.1 MAG: hypothetical protein A3I34_02160 [Candidatus Jorgensenbacteria bacterium RIFCSPLOWO2_02_FULL_45_12]
MKSNNLRGRDSGFSLVELMIYVGVFAVSAVFLVSILTVVTQVQLKQVSLSEVNQQLSFVSDTIKRLVQNSSLVDMSSGVSSSTLTLRMASSSVDRTLVYASGSILYSEEINSDGTTATRALTDSNVTVDDFSVTKYENPVGFSVVGYQLTLSYNTTNAKSEITRSLQTAIGRISAAEFDSSVYPNSDNSHDLGTALKKWKDAYLSGVVGIGVSSFSSGYKLVASGGDIATKDINTGFVVKTPDASACYRLGVSNSGTVTSTAVTCP